MTDTHSTDNSPNDNRSFDAAPTVSKAQINAQKPVFIHGSLLRHICIMTGTSAIGLLSIFAVDFLSLFYISRLNQPDLTAAVGFSSQIIFVALSINIGLSIAVTALVSRALGANERLRAQRLAASALVQIFCITTVVMLAIWFARHALLEGLLGARGIILENADAYLGVALFSVVPLSLGMALAGILRALGDAKRAMFVTLFGAIFTAFCDPFLIFGLHLGLHGAAITAVVEAVALMFVGAYGVMYHHRFLTLPKAATVLRDIPPLMAIAVPAIMTNLATPFASITITRTLAQFGPDAIVASTLIDRMTPFAFGAIFALSSALGPIIGQNFGARKFGRVRHTLQICLMLTTCYVFAIWGVLVLSSSMIASLFNLPEKAAEFLSFYCQFGVVLWIFLSMLFVANAAFNNLGYATYSTLFNWGRATLGTAPFVILGAKWGGVGGVYLGMIMGCAIFGLAALATAFLSINALVRREMATQPEASIIPTT